MRVVIADDHPLFRDGLRGLLEVRGIDVVGEPRNGREAVDQARRLQPEVVLMDLNMPEVDGLAAPRAICTRTWIQPNSFTCWRVWRRARPR